MCLEERAQISTDPSDFPDAPGRDSSFTPLLRFNSRLLDKSGYGQHPVLILSFKGQEEIIRLHEKRIVEKHL